MPFPATAGKRVGLEIWRIEKMEPAPVETKEHGKFYSGDCYLILNTFEKSGIVNQDLHFWLGEHSSQDERGAAAYQTVFLDDQLGGRPVQYREVQHYESPKFMSLFPNLQYLNGGVDSAFNKVGPKQYKPRLLHLKGKRNVRVAEVPLKAESMNQGDVFILDCGLKLYQWNGSHANKFEKAKGLEVLQNIKDNERNGQAEIFVLESSNETNADFWNILGGKKPIKGADEGGSDDEVKVEPTKLFLANGNNLTEVATGEFERGALNTHDIFVVDKSNEVFLWLGKAANKESKKNIMRQASEFLRSSGRPDHTPVVRVTEGAEPVNFTSCFKNWNPPRVVGVGVEKKATQEEKVDLEALRTRQVAEEKMVDDATGKLQIWRIENFNKVELPTNLYGQFFSGDSYILLYTYQVRGKDKHIIYFWQGRASSNDEKGSSALLAKDLDDSMGGEPVQVRVVQNKEPNHFLSLFKGKMVVHEGGVPSAFKNRNETSNVSVDGIGLYHVRGTNDINTRGVQVPASASSLNSSDCFVLKTDDAVYVWQGRGANDGERAVATNIANILKGNRGVQQVAEGSESEAFWSAIGGRGDYPQTKTLEHGAYEPRLFHCTTAQKGYFTCEEIPNFTQDDLINDDVMLLDTYDEVFVWVGHDATKAERDKSIETAIDYVKSAKDGRSVDTPIFKVISGSEPPNFTCHFHGWSDDKAQDFADPYLKKLGQIKSSLGERKEAGVERVGAHSIGFATPGTVVYTYEQLKTNQAPNIDLANKELYLNDQEFKSLFGMDKAAFAKLPKWKQADSKKKVQLF